jgi:two-component system response regulator YesN
VLAASNISVAKEMIETNHIDIILCDIEMPQGNGFELIDWINEHFSYIESIILTCHIDFTYAQQALKIGCLDYILKPIQNEALETALIKAINRINSNNNLQENSKFSEYWMKYHSVVSEKFWLDLIRREIGSNPDRIEKEAKNRNIPYSNDLEYVPILFSVKGWNFKYNSYDMKVMTYGLRNIACEILLTKEFNGQMLELCDDEFLVLIPIQIKHHIDLNHLKNLCNDSILSCHQHLECDLVCYIGNSTPPCGLPDRIDQLIILDRENVCIVNQVILQNEMIGHDVIIEYPDMSLWSMMLSDDKADLVILEVKKSLSCLGTEGQLNANLLKIFLHDFMQMIYNLLEPNGISAHQIMDAKESIDLYEKASHSLTDFVSWIVYISDLTANLIRVTRDSDSAAEKIKNYIEMNLNHDITRKSLAEKFFFNANYIDRIFKKKYGLTIAKYIWKQRIVIAQQLLSQTDINVSEIAVSLGFSNFSHFSTMFKKQTHLSPSDYRRGCINSDNMSTSVIIRCESMNFREIP